MRHTATDLAEQNNLSLLWDLFDFVFDLGGLIIKVNRLVTQF